MKNGWKNSGAPWTYKINPEQVKPVKSVVDIVGAKVR
jgi:hypothetical protein